jgi:hypothetical protein
MPQPVSRGPSENANPGIEGATTWKAPAGSAPWARGSVSGPMMFMNSTIDPGQLWVRSNGSASGSGDRTCRKWILWPSISVVYCGNSLSFASNSRQS